MNIGIQQMGGKNGTNGLTYLNMLMHAIQSRYGDEVNRTLIVFYKEYLEAFKEYSKGVNQTILLENQFPAKYSLEWLKDGMRSRIQGKDFVHAKRINQTLHEHEIHSIFGVFPMPLLEVPWVTWIQDFQHFWLPDFFAEEECQKRDVTYKFLAKEAHSVILSSETAAMDFKKLYPDHSSKSRVMRFVANIPDYVYKNSPNFICTEYGLPEKFLYVPNQFWIHKNHKILFKAIQIAKEKHTDLCVVISGNTNDFRYPQYFSELLQYASKLKIRNNIAILGLVPREHFYYLFRQAIALINPSLFEGWSTSVEEAKSLGKPIILSDLDVHIEQAPPHARYFIKDDPQSLSDSLCDYWSQYQPGPNNNLEERSRDLLPIRIREYGETFVSIMEEASK